MPVLENESEYQYEVYMDLIKAYRVIHRLRLSELARLGHTIGYTGMSYRIAKFGDGITISELADIAKVEPHTVTEMINKMVEAGLVIKQRDKIDKRVVRVYLTEEGKRHYDRSKQHRQAIKDVFSCLTLEEAKQLKEYLERLRQRGEKMEREKEKKVASPTPITA